ncbi:hypothetical protein [Stomatobaculum longum]|uniref:hypothetical protein n=1 Tax=Stomatobaculum longum TaxID=796942 RepID=UPI0028805216|nr:hypothetical protein [Stomatobaculum longum]
MSDLRKAETAPKRWQERPALQVSLFEAFGFGLLSMRLACKASEALPSKKPPAMRVEKNDLFMLAVRVCG